MQKKPMSQTSQSKTKKPVSKSSHMRQLKDLVSEPKAKSRPTKMTRKSAIRSVKEIQEGNLAPHAKTTMAIVYELNMTLTLTKKSQRLNVTVMDKKNPKAWVTETTEKVVDRRSGQIFNAGSANVSIKTAGEGVEDTLIGLDAVDVQLVLQLLGLAV
jgi:hypothetical protein